MEPEGEGRKIRIGFIASPISAAFSIYYMAFLLVPSYLFNLVLLIKRE